MLNKTFANSAPKALRKSIGKILFCIAKKFTYILKTVLRLETGMNQTNCYEIIVVHRGK